MRASRHGQSRVGIRSGPHHDRVGAGILGDLECVHPRVGAVLDLLQIRVEMRL